MPEGRSEIQPHPSWHFIVRESVGTSTLGTFGWCIDCQRTVPVAAQSGREAT